jgi:septum formation topological specificity factor MinE
MKTFMAAKNEAYENLNEILNKNGKKSNDKLSEELQILIARYGVAGSERIATTDYLMKQIIEMLLADIHKYVVVSAFNNSGLFGLGEWTELDDEICKILKINKEQRIRLSNNYSKEMIEEFENFKEMIK